MAKDIRLPIKIVVPREEDVRRPEHAGGGGAKMFDDVTPEIRDAADRTRQVIQAALSSLEDYGWRMDVVEVDRQRAYLDQVSKAMMDDFYARAQDYVTGFGSKVTTA